MGRKEPRFALVERRGFRERPIAESDELAEIVELAGEKAGMLDVEFGGED